MTSSHLLRHVLHPLLAVIAAAAMSGCRGKIDGPDPGVSSALGGSDNGNLCDTAQAGFGTRPRWSELGDVPNYEKVSENFNAQKTVLLLSSAMNKAVTRIGRVRSELEQVKATGTCDCKGAEDQCDQTGEHCDVLLHPVVAREDCQTACQALADAGTCGATGEQEGWQLDDLYYGPRNVARKAIEHVKFLDGIVDFITGSGFGDALAAAGGVANGLADVSQFLQNLAKVVDQFTEGFHLGAYSQDRPDLWYCVPRAGSGVYAPMANLANGKFSIGASYTSGLAAKKVHGVFSMGAATVEANGKSYPFLPGVAYNVELDGWKMFDRNHLFGIEGLGAAGGSAPVATIAKADIFNLVDNAAIDDLAGSDGQLSWHDLLVKSYFPADYVSNVDQQPYTWPRASDEADTERTSKAVFGAGLDLALELKKKEFDLPAIPIGGFASVKPFFTVEAGVAWHNKHDKLKKRIQDSLHIAPTTWSRDRHAMQAPDSSRDVGVSGHVDPAAGAELNLGVRLARFVEMGIFARISLKLGIEPGTYGDTMDTSSALTRYLATINPPVSAPCDPIVETTETTTCTKPKYTCPITNGLAPSNVPGGGCVSHGPCRIRADQVLDDLTEAQCNAQRGTWSPYMCAPVTTSQITGWQGAGCNPLSSSGTGYIGLGPVEQGKLDALLAAQAAPNHSIFTYALADLAFKALLDASAMVQLRIKIFKWRKTFTLFKWSDFWNLGSTNKTWFQEGLEAQYEDDCAAPGGVFNHQPTKVKRYPAPGGAEWSEYDQSHELIHNWCYPSIEGDTSYADYAVPTNQGIVDTIKHVTDMGHEVGEQMWGSNQLCVGGDQLFTWLADPRKDSSSSRICVITMPSGGASFAASGSSGLFGPCESTFQLIAQASSCLDAESAPAGAPLTADGHYVDLGALFGANATDLDATQLLPAYATPAWTAWITGVEACLDAAHADQAVVSLACRDASGQLGECKPERCCGDGVLSPFEACDPSVPNGAVGCTADCQLIVCGDGKKRGQEQCDDGNTTSGDGCSTACKIEKKKTIHTPPTTPGSPKEEPTPRSTSSFVAELRGAETLSGEVCEAPATILSDLEVKVLTAELETACGANPKSPHCEAVARAKASQLINRAKAQPASTNGCWIPERSVATTSLGLTGGLLVAQGNIGMDLVYRFREKQFAAFFVLGGGSGITAQLGVGGAMTFNFGWETAPTTDIITLWSGPFTAISATALSNSDWVKKVFALKKNWGFGAEVGYFQGSASKGVFFTLNASYSADAVLELLKGATLPIDASINASNWIPWNWATSVLHKGIFSDWGEEKWSADGKRYLQFSDSEEYVVHMMRNVITIPAALAYVAWGVCNGL